MIDKVFVDIESLPNPRYSVVFNASVDLIQDLELWVNQDTQNRSLKRLLKNNKQIMVVCNQDQDLQYLFSHYALRNNS